LIAFVSSSGEARGFDFRQFWQGGHDVVHGVSPYPDRDRIPTKADGRKLDPTEVQEVFRFPYPAPTALTLAPLGALRLSLATGLFLTLLVFSVPATLLALGVSDWRCYGLAFAWLPVLTAIRLGTLTPLLLLGAALAWWSRDRRWGSAFWVAATIVVKVFFWPLLVWLAASRRYFSAVAAIVLSVALVVVGWAALDFRGFVDYPHLVRSLSEAGEDKGFSLTALALAAGRSTTFGHTLGFAAGGALLAAGVYLGRRHDSDSALFALACGSTILLSPLLWLHYFAVLLVVVAVTNPRLSVAWIVPLAFWATPEHTGTEQLWQIALALATYAVTLVFAIRGTAQYQRSSSRAPMPPQAASVG
jgi:Glycosyltransferase family 87